LNPEEEDQEVPARQDLGSSGALSGGKISSFGSQNKAGVIPSQETVIQRKQTALKQAEITNNENKSFT